MEGEINNFIKVWLSILVSLSYCYAISKIVSKGLSRLLCVLPIVFLFIFLPLDLHSIHLRSTTTFFIVWLANFKLLLFALGRGPLCSDPSISLGCFVALACLPIKIQQNTPPKKINPSPLKSHLNGHNKENPPPKPIEKPKNPPMSHLNGQNKENPTSKKTQERHISPLIYAIKGYLFFSILACLYDYSDYMHPKVIMLLYCLHTYFLLEFILAIASTLARALLGIELESQFNEPYLTTSLQDFWGGRWNLMVTNILCLSVYNLTRHMMTCVIGHRWAQLFVVFATFVVSGLMHELMFYYMGLVKPSWEVTWFFLLHGLCLVVEVVMKEVVLAGRFWLPWLISGPLTIGFVIITSFWLFFPPFL